MIIDNKNSTIILVIILALTGIFFGSSYPLDIYGTSNKDLSLAELFESVENSVVQITRTVPGTDPYAINEENSTTLGSGFLYNDKGYIITNNHVVENAKTVDVSFINGDRYTANITGTDPFSDLALIKINENFTKLPKALAIGNSTALKVGEQVVAIGNPFGLEGSMTTGIVSQVGRLLSVDGQGFSIPNAIQTDASINPGNSGGPLLNMKAEVIGVNTAGIFPGGIGLAVSSDTVQRIIPILMNTGNYTHPWLGITGTTLTSELAKREKIDNSQKGVIIDNIVKKSPADLAGLNGSIINQYGEKRGGDIILKIDGKPIIKIEELISYMDSNKAVNDTSTITVYRDGKILEKQIIFKERPLSPQLLNQTQN